MPGTAFARAKRRSQEDAAARNYSMSTPVVWPWWLGLSDQMDSAGVTPG